MTSTKKNSSQGKKSNLLNNETIDKVIEEYTLPIYGPLDVSKMITKPGYVPISVIFKGLTFGDITDYRQLNGSKRMEITKTVQENMLWGMKRMCTVAGKADSLVKLSGFPIDDLAAIERFIDSVSEHHVTSGLVAATYASIEDRAEADVSRIVTRVIDHNVVDCEG